MTPQQWSIAEIAARTLVELGVLGGLIAFVSNRWATKYTVDLNAKHQRELALLTAKADVAGSISKAQFDAEISAVTAVWGHVHEVRGALLNALVPTSRHKGDEPDEKDARMEWLERRVNAVTEPRNQLVNAVHGNAPFYPAEIRDAFGMLITTVDLMRLQVLREAWTSDWFEKNDQRREQLIAFIGVIEQMIRIRLASLRLSPNIQEQGVFEK